MNLSLIGLIALGAAIGGAGRFALAQLSQQVTGAKYAGTFSANMLACLLAGALWGLVAGAGAEAGQHQTAQAFFVTGMAGALSTWSTFAGEIVALAKRRSPWVLGYPGLTVVLGLTCGFIGTFIPPHGVY